jgi:hypothetical protein
MQLLVLHVVVNGEIKTLGKLEEESCGEEMQHVSRPLSVVAKQIWASFCQVPCRQQPGFMKHQLSASDADHHQPLRRGT